MRARSEEWGQTLICAFNEEWGHPLKGVSREKTPLPTKKSFLFSLDTYFPTARCCFSTRLAPVISILSVYGSTCVDPHQSPIRFKAVVF